MRSGFSLVELLLVFGLLAILTAVASPNLFNVRSGADFQNAVQVIAGALTRAQFKAQAMEQDAAWGVKINQDQAVIFRGTSYAGRDASYDEKASFGVTITVTAGPDEIIFNKLTGLPVGITSDTTIALSGGGAAKSFIINQRGTVLF